MEDLELITKILGADLPEFDSGFLAANPMPLDDEDTPKYTEKEWYELCIGAYLYSEYKRGKYIKGRSAVELKLQKI